MLLSKSLSLSDFIITSHSEGEEAASAAKGERFSCKEDSFAEHGGYLVSASLPFWGVLVAAGAPGIVVEVDEAAGLVASFLESLFGSLPVFWALGPAGLFC